jgi:signal transduction histidine kinase
LKQDSDLPTSSASARLEVVGELATLIDSTFDLTEIFQQAILKLRRVMTFRRASVVLLSEDPRYYHLHTLYDATHGGFIKKEERFVLDYGLPGRVIRTGQAMRVDEFRGTEGIRTEGEEKVSALIIPLRVDEEVIGTLNLGVKDAGSYDDEDLGLATVLGRQIATSLHYSKLLATIRQQQEALAREMATIRSERARLEVLIEASDSAIFMVTGGIVAHANRAIAQLVGLPREVIVGAPLTHLDRALARCLAQPDALAAQTAALQGSGNPLRDRVEFVFPRRLVCQRTVAVLPGEAEQSLGHVVIYRDVTKEAEVEAAKDEFVSMVSHELRTPLTSVKTSLSLVLKGAAGTVSDQIRGLLEIALRNLHRLIRLVDDLLDLSRIESGRLVAGLVPVSVVNATDHAVEAVRGFALEREVMLECDRPPDPLAILGDADRLEQVIVNLLSNAVKFSPRHGEVTLRWRKENGSAVLEITDTGPGIPAHQLEDIFDKFHQLEMSATRREGGAGLGLPISRSIVEQLGGDLWVESEEGRGSSFFVRLQLAQELPETRDGDVETGGG